MLARRHQTALAVLCFVALLSGCEATPPVVVRPPNIVILLADDLGWADLGVHGSTEIRTPHIDALAAQGLRFANAYATASLCAPSRAGLLTGRYPHRFGMERNRDEMPASERTMAEILREAGYATGIVGKWHLGRDERGPDRQGFDEHVWFQDLSPGYEKQVGEFLPIFHTRKATEFIGRHEGRPFFLYLSFSMPHAPLRAPQEYLDRYPDIDDVARKTYAAMVSALDDAVGRVLAKLHDKGLDESTLVIFLNDNGGPGSSGIAAAKNASSNAPLRGYKQDLYEGGIRVPMIWRWGGRLQAGRIFDPVVSTMDLLPTIAASADVTLPTEPVLDGVNLWPYIEGRAEGNPHEHLFWRLRQSGAARQGPWKMVSVEGRNELFNLEQDLAERHDLSARHPEILMRLAQAYNGWALALQN